MNILFTHMYIYLCIYNEKDVSFFYQKRKKCIYQKRKEKDVYIIIDNIFLFIKKN